MSAMTSGIRMSWVEAIAKCALSGAKPVTVRPAVVTDEMVQLNAVEDQHKADLVEELTASAVTTSLSARLQARSEKVVSSSKGILSSHRFDLLDGSQDLGKGNMSSSPTHRRLKFGVDKTFSSPVDNSAIKLFNSEDVLATPTSQSGNSQTGCMNAVTVAPQARAVDCADSTRRSSMVSVPSPIAGEVKEVIQHQSPSVKIRERTRAKSPKRSRSPPPAGDGKRSHTTTPCHELINDIHDSIERRWSKVRGIHRLTGQKIVLLRPFENNGVTNVNLFVFFVVIFANSLQKV